jgi:hypothetical protein
MDKFTLDYIGTIGYSVLCFACYQDNAGLREILQRLTTPNDTQIRRGRPRDPVWWGCSATNGSPVTAERWTIRRGLHQRLLDPLAGFRSRWSGERRRVLVLRGTPNKITTRRRSCMRT